jgi:peptide/nickel transport system permease protein
MATERGRIQIEGFDPERVTDRDPLSEWTEATSSGTESRWQRAWRRFRRNRTAMIGLWVVALMTVITVFARPVTVAGVTVQPFSLAP